MYSMYDIRILECYFFIFLCLYKSIKWIKIPCITAIDTSESSLFPLKQNLNIRKIRKKHALLYKKKYKKGLCIKDIAKYG